MGTLKGCGGGGGETEVSSSERVVVGDVVDNEGDGWRCWMSEAGEEAVAWDACLSEALEDVALEGAGEDEVLLVLFALSLSIALRNVV